MIKFFMQVIYNKMGNKMPMRSMPIRDSIDTHVSALFLTLFCLIIFLVTYIFTKIESILVNLVRVHDLNSFSRAKHAFQYQSRNTTKILRILQRRFQRQQIILQLGTRMIRIVPAMSISYFLYRITSFLWLIRETKLLVVRIR